MKGGNPWDDQLGQVGICRMWNHGWDVLEGVVIREWSFRRTVAQVGMINWAFVDVDGSGNCEK